MPRVLAGQRSKRMAVPVTNDYVFRLIDAICESFDAYMTPTADQTFCNLAVQYVLARFGYEKMKGMVANQMCDFMSRSDDWNEVNIEDVQYLANRGDIVVLGETGDPHGHVVIVRPGTMEFSNKWVRLTPKVSNVGLRPMGQIGKGASWAFKRVPRCWTLRGDADGLS